jgi:porin
MAVGGRTPATGRQARWGSPTSRSMRPDHHASLFQAWLQQSLFDDRLAVLAGLYPIDSEFFTIDSAGVSSSGPHYGTPADLALTRGPSIFNNSAFGLRAKVVYRQDGVCHGRGSRRHSQRSGAAASVDGDPLRQGRWQLSRSANSAGCPRRTTKSSRATPRLAFGALGLQHQGQRSARYRCRRQSRVALPARRLPVLGERTLAQTRRQRRAFSFRLRPLHMDATATRPRSRDSLNLGLHAQGAAGSRVPTTCRRHRMVPCRHVKRKWRDVQTVPGNTQASEERAGDSPGASPSRHIFAIQPNYQYIRHPGRRGGAECKIDRGARRPRHLKVGAGDTATPACYNLPHDFSARAFPLAAADRHADDPLPAFRLGSHGGGRSSRSGHRRGDHVRHA